MPGCEYLVLRAGVCGVLIESSRERKRLLFAFSYKLRFNLSNVYEFHPSAPVSKILLHCAELWTPLLSK